MKRISLLILSILCVSCSYAEKPNNQNTDCMKQLDELKYEIACLRSEIIGISDIKSEIESIDSSIRFHGCLLDTMSESVMPTQTTFNLKDSKGFHVVNTREGHFLVSVKEVKPYHDYYKVVFEIGNPYAIKFENPTLKLAWICPYKKYRSNCEKNGVTPSFKDWIAQQKEKEFSLIKVLQPATWNTVEVVINASSDDLEDVTFSIPSAGTIVMSVDKT